MADEQSGVDEAQPEMTARERRAQRVREGGRREAPKKAIKTIAIVLIVVLLLAGAVWAVQRLNSLNPGCPLENRHEHAAFYVFVPDEQGNYSRVNFNHAALDLQGGGPGVLPLKMHMHQPNDWQLHAEFGCATMGDFFGYIGGDLSNTRLKLDTYANGGETYEESGNMTVRTFLYSPDLADESGMTGTWNEVFDLAGHQPRDLERMLITYGDWNEDELRDMRSQVPIPTDSVPPELRGGPPYPA